MAPTPSTSPRCQQLPPHPRDGYGLPRGLIIILGLAAAVVVAAGIHAVPGILGPIFLAVVLVVTVDPIRGWMIRKGAPAGWRPWRSSSASSPSCSGCSSAAIIGIAQLATLLPQYADQIQQEITNFKSWLAGMGVSQSDIQTMISSID